MMKIFSVLLFLLMLPSCSLLENRNVTVGIPMKTELERLTDETPWYTMTVFDGGTVKKKHLTQGFSKTVINVERASLSLVLLTPEDRYSPLGAFLEPGMKAEDMEFTHDRGNFIEFLMSIASERPGIVSSLSLSALERHFPLLSSIDKEVFASKLSSGSLKRSSELDDELVEVVLDALPSGLWEADREDIDDIYVCHSGTESRAYLYPGRYRFICRERKLTLSLTVLPDGQADSFINALYSY